MKLAPISMLFLFHFCNSQYNSTVCPPHTSITLNEYLKWPGDWDYPAPNQDCTLEVNYDNSSYLEIFITLSKGDTLYINDSYGNYFKKEGEDDGISLRKFPPPLTTFQITTGPNRSHSSFSLSTTNFSLEAAKDITKLEVGPYIVPTTPKRFHSNNTYVITASSKVALSFIWDPDVTGPYMLNWWAIFVYDGTGSSATLIGPLYNAANTTIYSTSNTMTIYSTVDMSFYPQIIINDYSNLANLTSYELSWAYNYGSDRNSPKIFLLDARDGPAALTISSSYYHDDYSFVLSNITHTDSAATLSVYAGAPTQCVDYLLAAYNCGNISLYLPQLFLQRLTTFVLSSGMAALNIAGDTLDHYQSWSVDEPSHHGLIMTEDYGFPSTKPNTYLRLKSASDQVIRYEFNLLHFDEKHDGEDNFTIYLFDPPPMQVTSLSLATMKNRTVVVDSRSMDVYIFPFSKSNASRGALVSFSMTKAQSTISHFSVETGLFH